MIRLLATRLSRAELQTRLPFKYGIATMTHLPHVFLRATCEIDGRTQDGIAADHLPPKWFTKDPVRDPADEIVDMLRVIEHAMSAAAGIQAASVFAFWRDLYHRQSAWGAAEDLPPLLVHFGTSLVERAVLDAFARHHETPFHRLLQTGALGLDLGAFHAELDGSRPADWLPAEPLPRITVRHTVGLADPLTAADIAPGTRLGDGLPQSLKECIRTHGLRHFKIKINGQPDRDIDRLEKIAALLARHAPPDYAFSLDGNESFRSVTTFRDFWTTMIARPGLKEFVRRLLFVEQPLHRDVALDESAGAWRREWPGRPPIIIDESDAEPGSLRRALDLGYAGTSHKNCKGVFKGIANACRIAQLRRERPEAGFLLSGEDLSNIGPVALPQDLAVQAALGIASVERNGHHYFAGLSFWPASWQDDVLALHPDLYTTGAPGWPQLAVVVGKLRLGSVNAAPFGTGFLPQVTEAIISPPLTVVRG
jgi:L-alanine-DL-glutamate epimerase-like enolase superfamily enzyme